jgi:uncharacterized protein (DUF4415 family)
MNARKRSSSRTSDRRPKSDMRRVDAHTVQPSEYRELPQINEAMLKRAVVRKGGRPISSNPRLLVFMRLPADVLARWKATGPGWQTRMARVIERARPQRQ